MNLCYPRALGAVPTLQLSAEALLREELSLGRAIPVATEYAHIRVSTGLRQDCLPRKAALSFAALHKHVLEKSLRL